MSKIITFELISVLASVLAFRGLWLLMDRLAWFNSPAGLVVSFTLGIIIIGWSLRYIHKCLRSN
ncbi:MAG: hypothetical protein WC980_03870 [Candidatus Brocadiia bacterium]